MTDVSVQSVGFWMTAAGAAFLLVTAARAVRAPAAFPTYFGLPLANPGDIGFVRVYASRSIFIGLLAVALLVRRDLPVLTVFTLLAVPMPITDAIMVRRAGAGRATVLRHSAVAVFLLATSFLLWRGI